MPSAECPSHATHRASRLSSLLSIKAYISDFATNPTSTTLHQCLRQLDALQKEHEASKLSTCAPAPHETYPKSVGLRDREM